MSWSRSPSAVQPFSSCYTRRTSQPELNEESVGGTDCAQVSRFPCLYKRQIVLSSDSQLSSASIISPHLIHANLHLLLRSTETSRGPKLAIWVVRMIAISIEARTSKRSGAKRLEGSEQNRWKACRQQE